MDFQMLFSSYFARRTDTSGVSVSGLFMLIFSTAPRGSFAYAVVDCFSPGHRFERGDQLDVSLDGCVLHLSMCDFAALSDKNK